MTTSSYGEHAEAAAAAIAALVRGDPAPAAPGQWRAALAAREVVIGALWERLVNQLGVQVKTTDPALADPADPVTLASVQDDPLTHLAGLLAGFPRLPEEDRVAPTEALTGSADPVTQTWVQAARELVVANHLLDAAEAQPWRTDPAARAALAADTAQLVEALAVLDQRLDAAAALTGHVVAGGEAATRASVTTARLLASTVDRLAQWTADHAATDLAGTAPWRPAEHHRPVRLVRVPGDLAGAQTHLGSLLGPMAARDLPLPYRLSADTAVTVARNQAILLHHLDDRVAASPELSSDRAGDHTGATAPIRRLRDLFDQAVYTLTGLYDAAGARTQHPLRNQQREISVAVNTGHLAAATDRQATELLSATEATLSTWAAAVRREAGRDDTDLRLARRGPTGNPVYGRIPRDGPADPALAALADNNPSVPQQPATVATRARGLLRDTLTQSPPSEDAQHWPCPGRRHQNRTPEGHRPPTVTAPDR